MRRRSQAVNNNHRENSHRIRHEYSIGDEILIFLSVGESEQQKKIGNQVMEKLYEIARMFRNGTVRILRGLHEETMSIRNLRHCRTYTNFLLLIPTDNICYC